MADDGTSLVKRLRDGLRLVSTVVQAFAESTSDYHRLLDAIARNIAEAIPDTCIVLLRSGDAVSVVALKDGSPAGDAWTRVLNWTTPLCDAPISTAVLARGPMLVPRLDFDALRGQLTESSLDLLAAAGATGMLMVPLATGRDHHGLLCLLRHGDQHPPLDELDLEIVLDLANHAALAISNARLFQELERTEQLRQAEQRAVAEHRNVIAELSAAKRAADAANRELESFSYSVAHDLRSPLRAIDGFGQALLEDYGDRLDDEGLRYVARVREAAQRMAELIDDLLTLSRVTRSELRREEVDMSALARTLLAGFQRHEPERDVEIVIAPGLVAQADRQLTAIALDNLLGNAWKFTAKRTRARIEVGATCDNGETAYFVRDNGAGFDMTYRHKLFGVFQRLHPESDFPGTGVGLATVARITARHRGRIWAHGMLDEGATFYFTLDGVPCLTE